MKQFGVANDANDLENFGLNQEEAENMINYKKCSINLGLHKESYNYLNKVQSLNRIKNMSKLRQLYTSVDSPSRKKTINDASELY